VLLSETARLLEEVVDCLLDLTCGVEGDSDSESESSSQPISSSSLAVLEAPVEKESVRKRRE
jgi:hypothetical protein